MKAEVGAWSLRERVQGQQYDEDGRKLTLTGDKHNSCLEEIDCRKRRLCYIVGVYLSRNVSAAGTEGQPLTNDVFFLLLLKSQCWNDICKFPSTNESCRFVPEVLCCFEVILNHLNQH